MPKKFVIDTPAIEGNSPHLTRKFCDHEYRSVHHNKYESHQHVKCIHCGSNRMSYQKRFFGVRKK
jgi:hypothetical protein